MIRKFTAALFCFSLATTAFSQESQKHLPIIDVHVHAMKVNPPLPATCVPGS